MRTQNESQSQQVIWCSDCSNIGGDYQRYSFGIRVIKDKTAPKTVLGLNANFWDSNPACSRSIHLGLFLTLAEAA